MADEKLSYEEALHGIQSGIRLEIENGSDCASPKHLRVGLNASKSDQAGLVRLLISKGIFTEEEYVEAVTDAINCELEREEKIINDLFNGGGKIKLR